MKANDVQVGGDHYKKRDYQTWDFICDINIHFLLGSAIKYSRWRDKNGIEDLHKINHYILKAFERKITPPKFDDIETQVKRFCEQFEHEDDRELISLICAGEYERVAKHVFEMIAKTDNNLNGIDQKSYFRG